ncbi:MAG: M50 family metallopeptidase [Deltaproteobacteria bacterium]
MTLGRVAGVNIRVNLIFLLLAAGYAALGMGLEIIVIISSLFIHEMAHTVVAMLLGVKVSDIEILPFGGQARIEDLTGLEPEIEVYIALAGPLVSLSLAGLAYFLHFWPNSAGIFLVRLNLGLGLFNLLPALPLDGGRIMRAAMSGALGFKRATRYAALLGQVMGVGLIGAGGWFFNHNISAVNLIIIGIFLFWASHREKQYLAYAFMRFLINKKAELARTGLLESRQVVACPSTRITRILDNAQPTHYLLVVVMDGADNVVGMLGEARLIETLLEKGPRATLADC